jgi:hypothetical protein
VKDDHFFVEPAFSYEATRDALFFTIHLEKLVVAVAGKQALKRMGKLAVNDVVEKQMLQAKVADNDER